MNKEQKNLSQQSYLNSENHLNYQSPQLRKHGTIHDLTLAIAGGSENEGAYVDVAPPIS